MPVSLEVTELTVNRGLLHVVVSIIQYLSIVNAKDEEVSNSIFIYAIIYFSYICQHLTLVFNLSILELCSLSPRIIWQCTFGLYFVVFQEENFSTKQLFMFCSNSLLNFCLFPVHCIYNDNLLIPYCHYILTFWFKTYFINIRHLIAFC